MFLLCIISSLNENRVGLKLALAMFKKDGVRNDRDKNYLKQREYEKIIWKH